MSRASVTAPIASATSVAQLLELTPAASLKLTDEDIRDLKV
jgi:aryl-alcohol dehydrogenase-like predicted oxidoreductase